MIFYFTGTGNSEYTARRVAEKTGGGAISIAESVKAGKNKFYLADGEALGFVFPVYAWNVPDIVERFIKEMELENYSGQYVFAVLTCGVSIGGAYGNLKKMLADRGITLNYAHDLVMPENYIIMFDSVPPEKQRIIFAAADRCIDEIAEAVVSGTEAVIINGKSPPGPFTRLVSHLFDKYAKRTKKFRATEVCVSCGFCERICPVSAIEMGEARPVWRGERCAKCMACINRCPVHAIEYGRSTKKRRRYVHPIYENGGQGRKD